MTWAIGGESAYYTPPDPVGTCPECEWPVEEDGHQDVCPLRPCEGCGQVGNPPPDTECDDCQARIAARPRGACRAIGCTFTGPVEDCPEHGIADFYRRCAAEGRDAGD